MLETVESGLISIWKLMYTAKAEMCQIVQPNSSVKAAMKPLQLSDFIGVMLTFGIGVAVGMFLLLFEWMRKHRHFDTVQQFLAGSRSHTTPVEKFYPDAPAGRKKTVT